MFRQCKLSEFILVSRGSMFSEPDISMFDSQNVAIFMDRYCSSLAELRITTSLFNLYHFPLTAIYIITLLKVARETSAQTPIASLLLTTGLRNNLF